jgi:hypothetical protein
MKDSAVAIEIEVSDYAGKRFLTEITHVKLRIGKTE